MEKVRCILNGQIPHTYVSLACLMLMNSIWEVLLCQYLRREGLQAGYRLQMDKIRKAGTMKFTESWKLKRVKRSCLLKASRDENLITGIF